MFVFDLDACCWSPEMYELWVGGAPFEQLSTKPNNQLRDCRGTTVRMLGDVAACWADLHARIGDGQPLRVGVASRSDEPSWARECLRKFIVTEPGLSMMDVVTEDLCEIYKGSKQRHLETLRRKTGIAYERMAFFDDDQYNIGEVAKLGVHCFYTPRGVTRDIYERACSALGVDRRCADDSGTSID